MPYLDQITVGSTTYDIQDSGARSSIPSAATTTPLSDGMAAVGTSTKYAREDHVHPKTSRTWLIKNGRSQISWQTGAGMQINENSIDSVCFTGSATGYHYAYYAIDLTNVDIIVVCESGVSASSSGKINGCAVWSAGTSLGTASNLTDAVRVLNSSSNQSSVVWDVSDLTGTYWVGVCATYTDKVYITTIYCEG